MTKKLILAFQHVLAMFGATVLVPLLTGLDTSIALFAAGTGTLIFHFVSKKVVPVFLGSSFAFIPGIMAVGESEGLGYATGAMVAVGLVYVVMAGIVYFVGADRVRAFFPAIVTGPVIIVIGLILAPIAVRMAAANWTLAFITMLTVVAVGAYARGFFQFIPIVTGIIVGYVVALATGAVDLSAVQQAGFFGLPDFRNPEWAPKFSATAMQIIVPIAIVSMIEHIGDITTNGAVVGKNFFKEPGLHRTLLGDGLATSFAGFVGGPANTTYGENTGVLAVTKNYDPSILRMAAVFAIILSLSPKFGALVSTIPVAVLGGVSFILFGMIASIGVRTLVDSKPDLSDFRNSIVVFVILILGIVSLTAGTKDGNPAVVTLTEYASLSGLSLAAVAGVTLNFVFNILLKKSTDQKPEISTQ